jgi:mannosyltransferase
VAVLATVVAAVLVGWDLGARSLWLDEAYTAEIAGDTWAHLWARVTSIEANMVLHYVLIHPVLAVARDERSMRALSAIAAVATVPVAYRLGVRTIGASGAAAGALLLATQPFFVRYGQEARGYSLAALLVVVSSLAVLRAIERPSAARCAVWALSAVAAIYGHMLAAPAVLVQVVAGTRRIPRSWFLIAAGVVGALVAPLVWFAVTRDAGQLTWLPPPTRWDVVGVLFRFTGDAGWLGLGAYAACVALAIAGGGAGFLLALVAVPFGLVLAVSPLKPLFFDRYVLFCVPPLALLAGAGLVRLPLRMVAIAALVVMQLVGLARLHAEPSWEDWRGAAAAIREAARAGDAAACWVDTTCIGFDYYFAPPRGGPPIVWLAGAVDDPAAMAAIVDSHPRVWLALSHVVVGQSDRRAMLARIEAALATSYVLEETRDFRGVTVRRYARQTSPNTR